VAVGSDRGRAVRKPALAGLLALAMAMAMAGPFLIGVLAPFIVEDLHLSRASLGLLATGVVAVAALLSPPAGSLADRLGGRPTLLATFAVTAAGAVGMAIAGSYSGLLLGAGVVGVAAALANPVTNQLVSEHIPRGAQGSVIGLKQSGVQAGTFLIGLVLPSAAAAMGWRRALALTILPAALGLLATVLVIPPVGRVARAARPPKGSPWRWPVVAKLTVYGSLMGLGTSAIGAYLVLYAVEALGLSESASGLAVAVLGLAGITSRIVWARRSERGGSISLVLIMMSLCGAGSVGLIWSAQLGWSWLLWVGALGFGATGVAWNAVGNLLLVRELPAGVAGRAAGVLQFGFFGGMAVGPPSFGWLVDATGSYGAGWLMVIVALAIAAGVILAWDTARRGGPPTRPA
jgi:MFS family permease